ncbi:unnamed protein product, partial [marine sediment metagenome]
MKEYLEFIDTKINGRYVFNNFEKRFLKGLVNRLDKNHNFNLTRVTSVVSQDTYEHIKSKVEQNATEKYKNHLITLQARHISIFEQLARLEKYNNYLFYVITFPVYVPQPTISYSMHNEGGKKDRVVWGFILPIGRQPKPDDQDIAVLFRSSDMVGAISKLISGTLDA